MFIKQQEKSVGDRVIKLKALKSAIEHNANKIAQTLAADFNKPEYESYSTEINFILSELNHTIKNLKKWNKPVKKSTPMVIWPAKSYIISQPRGRVLIFSPWNYPFQLSMAPAISAWAAGNQVVLKPSAQTPTVRAVIKEIIEKVFTKDEFEVMIGGRELSNKLLDQKWDLIFFTGSPSIGKMIAQKAAASLTPVVLELGGKSPCIISSEADLERAARRVIWGKFINAGQTCVAPDYLLIHKSIEEPFIDLLKVELKKQYSQPFKSDYPSIINDKNFQRLISLLEGQEFIEGGKYDARKKYIEPTLIKLKGWGSDVMKKEIFGPILPLLTWECEDELKAHLSKAPDPLAFYYFGSPQNGMKLMDQHAFGGGCINDLLIHLVNAKLPFGGVGNSGYGQYHGEYGFKTFTHQKGIVIRGKADLPIRYRPHSLSDLKWTRLLMR